MPRPLDRQIDSAIINATVTLLGAQGFAAMTIEAVAREANVSKPAIYRRFVDKAALVATVIARELPELQVPDLDNTRAELWSAVQGGFPADAPAYVRLIGGLIAEEGRHPELIAAFRTHILHPRRAIVSSLIERGQDRGDIGAHVDPEGAVDFFAGALLARTFAGIDTGPRWRKRAFETWWMTLAARQGP